MIRLNRNPSPHHTTRPPTVRRIAAVILAACCASAVTFGDARAQTVPVDTVTGAGGLTSITTSSSEYRDVKGYNSVGDGGGGIFYTTGSGVCPGIGGIGDGGLTIEATAGSAHSCWVRQYTGSIHLKWYGVTNTTNDAYNVLNSALQSAALTAPSNGSGCVDLDGLRANIGSATTKTFGALTIPPNVVLGCDDAPISGNFLSAQDDPDFTKMPNALVLYEDPTSFKPFPANSVASGSGTIAKGFTGSVNLNAPWGGPSTIAGTTYYAQIDNEIVTYTATNGIPSFSIVARAQLGTQAATHQPNAAVRDVPGNWSVVLGGNDGIENVNVISNKMVAPPAPPNNGLRHWLDDISGQFYGEGIQCNGDGCHIQNVNVLGFDTGIEAVGAPRLYMDHITVDANTCYWLHAIGGQNQGGDVRCYPLTVNSAANAHVQWDINNITASVSTGNPCSVAISNYTSLNQIENGDTIWISNVLSPQSCNGRWTVANFNSGTATFDLAGSSFYGPNTAAGTTLSATWSTGSAAVNFTTAPATPLNNIYGQQSIPNPNPNTTFSDNLTYPGSFLCLYGTAPICTPPIGFPRATSATSVNSIPASGNTSVTLTSATGWPSSGVVQVDDEYMPFTLSGTSLTITGRGAYGTATVAHPGSSGSPIILTVVATSNSTALNTTSLDPVQLTISSTAGWMKNGVLRVDNEDMLYTVVDGTTIIVTARGVYGTMVATHPGVSGVIALAPGAPSVVSVWPLNQAYGGVVMPVNASCSASALPACDASPTTVEFLNATTFTKLTGASCASSSSAGCASIYAGERIWTYNQAAGQWSGTPSLPACTQPTPGSGTTPLAPGNCPGTGFLIGDAYDGNDGVSFTNPFTYGHEVQYHIWNSNSTGLVLAGSDNHSELNDPNVIGYWFDGNTDRSTISAHGTHSNFIDILQDSSTQACNSVIGGEMDVDVANGHVFETDKGCLMLSQVNNDKVGVALVGRLTSEILLADNYMPNDTLYYDIGAQKKALGGGATNVFANGSIEHGTLDSGTAMLSAPNGSTPWEYNAPSNLVFRSDADNLKAAFNAAVSDLSANINIVTRCMHTSCINGSNSDGVRLPASANATDLTSNAGAGACIEIVNQTGNTIKVWGQASEQIALGGTGVNGSVGVSLSNLSAVTYCPVSGYGWVGH